MWSSCCWTADGDEVLTARDRVALEKLPVPLLDCARFIAELESDPRFIFTVHRMRIEGKFNDKLTYHYKEGFHCYDLNLYWPIIASWVLHKFGQIVTADDTQNLITFQLLCGNASEHNIHARPILG